MRSYIFTDAEVERLIRWLETGEEDDALRMTFVEIRRSYHRLFVHLEMMFLVIKELRRKNRWRRRLRLPKEVEDLVEAIEGKLKAARSSITGCALVCPFIWCKMVFIPI
jgi:hypothetical protein